MDGSCSPFCMARNEGRRPISYKFASSIFPYITSLTLLFFLLVLIADHHHQQENPSSFQQADPRYESAKLTGQKQMISKSSTRRDCRDSAHDSTNNGIHFSPIGRKGGRHSVKVPSFSWRDKIFSASAHEVPSGPNPISNR